MLKQLVDFLRHLFLSAFWPCGPLACLGAKIIKHLVVLLWCFSKPYKNGTRVTVDTVHERDLCRLLLVIALVDADSINP